LGPTTKFLISEQNGTELEFPKEHIPETQNIKGPTGLVVFSESLQDFLDRLCSESSSVSWTYDSEERPIEGVFNPGPTKINYSYTGDYVSQITVRSFLGETLTKTTTITFSWSSDTLVGVTSSV
jgi:hypothetical protein